MTGTMDSFSSEKLEHLLLLFRLVDTIGTNLLCHCSLTEKVFSFMNIETSTFIRWCQVLILLEKFLCIYLKALCFFPVYFLYPRGRPP